MRKFLKLTLMVASCIGMVAMYFSSTFIPVYVNGEYILVNQIIRYVLYALLAGISIYGFADLISPPSKKRRRRR